jgi:hypothetical protein
MASRLIEEFQAVIDKLHGEGHILATRLENVLADLKAHFLKDKAHDEAEVAADIAQIKTDVAPVVAEVKADAVQVATEVKGQVEANLAEAADVLKK